MVNSSSHQNVTSKWIPELRHHCPNTPIILVGTKYDLTEDYDTITNLAKKKEMPKNTKDGEDLCEKLKAIKYLPCSCKDAQSLKDVFDQAIRAVLYPKPQTSEQTRFCNLI